MAENLWSDSEAAGYPGDLGLRVYTSRLLGRDKSLVLHGGGNTSVKVREANLFGEDQARYIVTVPAEQAGLVLAKMKGAGVPCARIGTTGGETIVIGGEAPVSTASLKAAFEGWFPAYMGGSAS